MRHTITTDFKFCIGSFFGMINPGVDLHNPAPSGAKEDYYRTIMFWNADRKIIRINYIAHKTKYAGGVGGLQTGIDVRLKNERKAVEELLHNYPELVRMNTKRKSPFPEILLRRSR
jgi:hypothetical protein